MDDILKRLTDYIAQCPSANGRTFHEMQEEVLIAHAADEIVKLRAALREIIQKDLQSTRHPPGVTQRGETIFDGYFGHIARAALKGKQDD